jgi:glycosyltransferase involved in cell wall biosynthesis
MTGSSAAAEIPDRKVPLSIVVPVRNEADRMPGFLAAHRWAGEIIVVDNGCTDDTARIAAAAGVTVISRPEVNTGGARNCGAEVAQYDWVLTLDADEIAGEDVAAELRQVLAAPGAAAYRFRLRNFVMGREQRFGPFGRMWGIRLYRRSARWSSPLVHETLAIDGPVETLRSAIRHTPYRSLDDHLARMDRYARLGANMLHAAGRRASWYDRTVRPAWRFVRAWIFRGGILEGRVGWTLSRLDARSASLKYRYLHQLDRGGAAG